MLWRTIFFALNLTLFEVRSNLLGRDILLFLDLQCDNYSDKMLRDVNRLNFILRNRRKTAYNSIIT